MDSLGFIRARTLEEALSRLEEHRGKTRILAGGTDLLVRGRQGTLAGEYLLDVTGIPGLDGISETAGVLEIGALATHRQIEEDPLVAAHAPLLGEAAGAVGSPQIRNRGTLGGNIANASPAADTLAPLVALEAVAVVESVRGQRSVPVAALFRGPYQNELGPGEMITAFRMPVLPPHSRSRYLKVGRRNALAISRISMAGVVVQAGDQTVERVRLVPGSVFPCPRCLDQETAVLVGTRPTEARVREVAGRVARCVVDTAGRRWSTPYKEPVCSNLCERILRELIRGMDSECSETAV